MACPPIWSFANITVIIKLSVPAGPGDSKGKPQLNIYQRINWTFERVLRNVSGIIIQNRALHRDKWKIQHWIKWISLWCDRDTGAYKCPAAPVCSPDLSCSMIRAIDTAGDSCGAVVTKHAEADRSSWLAEWGETPLSNAVSAFILERQRFQTNSQRI